MLPSIFNPIEESLEFKVILDSQSSVNFQFTFDHSHLSERSSPNLSPTDSFTSFSKWVLVLLISISSAASLRAQSRGTDLDLRQFDERLEKVRQQELVPLGLGEKNAALLDAFYDQYNNPRSVETLRSLQRAYRTGKRRDATCLSEILSLANNLRLRNEFVRYAELGSDESFSDKKLAIRAAVSLTDNRKYSAAAKYYSNWLRITANEPESYLSVIVLIEKGRLNYLAGEYKAAETAFRRIMGILNSDKLDEKQKNQILQNSETTYRMMANTFLKTGDFDEAQKFIDLAGIDSTSPIRFLHEALREFANNNLDAADQLVHRFIAKQPNNSESYRLLRDLYLKRNSSNEVLADQQFVADLELIRRKFDTGKVLDDFLVSYYLKLDRTAAAKEILVEQRNKTLWRDRANRSLIDIAFREKSLDELLVAVIVEADEHDSLVAIRPLLKKNAKQIDTWAESITGFLNNREPVVKQLTAACLLLYQNDKTSLAGRVDTLIGNISKDSQSSRLRRIKMLTLLGRESVTQKQYQIALACFEKCLELNRSNKAEWMDQRTAFDSLLSSVFVYCRLDQRDEAMGQLEKAEKVLRYSPSLMHLKGWAKLQFKDLQGAIVDYQSFLDRFDKSGASQSLSALIERVRMEMAFAFFLMDRNDLASELVNQVLDRNPSGPDLDAFQKNNQKYIEKKKLFLEFANGVMNGGPFSLGGN